MQGRAQLVRQGCQELVFHAAQALRRAPCRALTLQEVCPLARRLLCRLVQTCIVDGNPGLRCHAGDEALAAFREDAGIRVSDEEPADHSA